MKSFRGKSFDASRLALIQWTVTFDTTDARAVRPYKGLHVRAERSYSGLHVISLPVISLLVMPRSGLIAYDATRGTHRSGRR